MWSSGSLRPSNNLSWEKRNFSGKGHSRTLVVKGELVFFTIPFHMLLRRSLLAPLEGSIFLEPSLLWLFSSSLFLLTSRFSSYCSCSLISWFFLVSSSILVVSVWICRANAAESWGALDSIWVLEGVEHRFHTRVWSLPHRWHQVDDAKIVSYLCSSRQNALLVPRGTYTRSRDRTLLYWSPVWYRPPNLWW